MTMAGTSTIDYPKTMVHPHYQKGSANVVEGFDPRSGKHFKDYQGTPDRNPPVHVYTPDQEERVRALGYLQYGEKPPAHAEYSEYPLTLCHPGHVEAVPDEKVPHKDETTGAVTIIVVPGKPEILPHAVVHSAAEEKAWLARGYRRPGQSNPTAARDAVAKPYVPGQVTHEWPKMVDGVLMQDPKTQAPGPTQYPKWITTGKDPNTGDPIGKTVASLEEERALRAKVGLPPPAVDLAPAPAPVAPAPSQAPAMTRGQKIAATKARKKAEKLAQQADQPAA
jgi:hypothetical protein